MRLLARQDDYALSETDADERIAVLDDRIEELRSASRRRDHGPIGDELGEAAGAVAIQLPAPVPSSLGRQAAGLLRELAEAEIASEDGEAVETVGEPIVRRFCSADARRFAAEPVLFSAAFERVAAPASSPDMRRNTEATGKLFLELMGDRPVAALDAATWEEFLQLISRLLKSHGKAHGRNRYEAVGRKTDEHREIADADAADAAATELLRARDDLPLAEKRVRLADRLVARLTMTPVRRHRDALDRIMKAAVERIGGDPTRPPAVPTGASR